MKKLGFILVIVMLFGAVNIGCGQASNKKDKKNSVSKSEKIEMYYFHFSRRCAGCKAVEAEAKKNLESLYPEEIKKGVMTFKAVNIEEDAGKAIASKYNESSQALIIVKGDKKHNITNEGFMYARSNPDKFKEIIKEKVEDLKKK